jgi:hypothetical protein
MDSTRVSIERATILVSSCSSSRRRIFTSGRQILNYFNSPMSVANLTYVVSNGNKKRFDSVLTSPPVCHKPEETLKHCNGGPAPI